VLLAVAGAGFARFHLSDAPRKHRIRHLAVSVTRIAVPSALFLAVVALIDDRYGWQNAVLLNEAIGPRVGPQRHYWFVETLVYTLLALLALFALPLLDRWERRLPFALPVALLVAGLAVRYGLTPLTPYDHFATPVILFWFFALGWAAAKAGSVWQRLLVTAVGAVSVAGYFGNPVRETVIAAGLALLTWLPHLPSLAAVNRVAGALAGSSLYIYLTHWQVYPVLKPFSPLLALLSALAVGVLFGAAVDRAARWVSRLRRSRRGGPASAPARYPNREGEFHASLSNEIRGRGNAVRGAADRPRRVRRRRERAR
jgi:peptidoglycan/LPS O-acetylase OafA/YrhL